MSTIKFAAFLLGLAAPPAASVQECAAEPWALSEPATQHEVYCKTAGKQANVIVAAGDQHILVRFNNSRLAAEKALKDALGNIQSA